MKPVLSSILFLIDTFAPVSRVLSVSFLTLLNLLVGYKSVLEKTKPSIFLGWLSNGSPSEKRRPGIS